MPSLLTIGSRQVMPWKNGGGSTTELYVQPPGAALDAFDWRLSLATIASPGPFSSFPGIDRSLALVDGAGVELTIQTGEEQRLQCLRGGGEDYCVQFAGEAQVAAQLLDGPTTDFNVMTRRSRCRHSLQRISLQEAWQFQHSGGYSLLFVTTAAPGQDVICRAAHSDAQFILHRHDSLLFDAADETHWNLSAAPGALLYAVQIIAL